MEDVSESIIDVHKSLDKTRVQAAEVIDNKNRRNKINL